MTEPIVVILQTYARTAYARETIAAARAHLRYPDLRWYVADDGSDPAHVDAVLSALGGVNLIGWHSARASYGATANRAITAAHEVSALVLFLEDDWRLDRPFDLWVYADLLLSEADIGMVRLGYPNAGPAATIEALRDRLYLRLDDTESRQYSQFAFTGHPSLRHRRFVTVNGPYPERLQPGDTELRMAWQCKMRAGADIVWPLELGTAGPFGHIGAEQSYVWNGGVEIV